MYVELDLVASCVCAFTEASAPAVLSLDYEKGKINVCVKLNYGIKDNNPALENSPFYTLY